MVLKKHELLEVIKKELYTPVVGDILGQDGLSPLAFSPGSPGP